MTACRASGVLQATTREAGRQPRAEGDLANLPAPTRPPSVSALIVQW